LGAGEMEDTNNPPVISEETLKEMANFFMKTSIPRILAERKKEKELQAK
jgi:hypothetical protein